MANYKLYKGFSTFKELTEQFNELIIEVKNITTIEGETKYDN